MKTRRMLPLFLVVLILAVVGSLALIVSLPGPARTFAQGGATPSLEMIEEGRQVAQEFGCLTCHTTTGARLIGPTLLGLYGSSVPLADGRTVVADETYIRGQLVSGHSATVLDYPSDVMPDYGALMSDEQVSAVVAWIVSLSGEAQPTQVTTPASAAPPFMLAEEDEQIARQLWEFLQEANYQENWSTIPGKGLLYRGQDPHGALLSTYLNPEAAQALQERPRLMPHGAIIVKENYTEDETLAAITVMVKSDGYYPDHNDWFWASYGPEGELDVAGPVPGCISCHGAVWSNDYVFSFPLAPLDPSRPRPRTVEEAGVPAVPPATPAFTPAPETPTPVPMVEVTPAIAVEDQPIVANSVVIAEVMSRGPGWLVIHADSNGNPGPVIGFAPVHPGRNPDVVVEIDAEQATTTLHAMLHEDTGAIGVYEFPEGDPPVRVEGRVAVVPFEVAGPAVAATATPAATPTVAAPATATATAVPPPTVAPTPTTAASPTAPPATPEATPELVATGRQIAQRAGCFGCHSTDGSRLLGPTFQGLYGSTVPLADGSTVVADEEYLHRSIVDPNAQIVRGFSSGLMPGNYGQQLDENEIEALIEFIKSLGI
ncbi:MAG: c-type cytochrome [Anaerolineae bacterium]|nr:c-type cytochrome [Anaerolineae bacterium]